MGTQIPDAALELVKRWEGLYKVKGDLVYPYVCPAKVWTIGYGSTKDLSGNPVTASTHPITFDEATFLLERDLHASVDWAVRYSPVLAGDPPRLAAITSFIYNLGPTRYKNSTLRKRINDTDYDSAKMEIKKWVWAGGRRLPGLIARRNDEARYLAD